MHTNMHFRLYNSIDSQIAKIQDTLTCSWKSHFILSRGHRARNFTEAEQMNVFHHY